MAQLEVRLFGEPRISLGDRQLNRLIGQKPGSLLCILLLNRPRPIPRETLASLLWPESDVARPSVRTALWRLRATLEPTSADHGRYIITTAQSVAFNTSSSHWLDVAEFDRLTGPVASDETPDERAARLRQACDLYHGDLIVGCYDDWCLDERERFQKRYVGALGELLGYHAARGEYDAAIECGRQIIQRDRTQETTHRELMRLHYLAGRREVAIQQYALCREILRHELGVEPMRETSALYERIRRELPVTDGCPDAILAADETALTDEEWDEAVAAAQGALGRIEAALAEAREAIARLATADRARHGGLVRAARSEAIGRLEHADRADRAERLAALPAVSNHHRAKRRAS